MDSKPLIKHSGSAMTDDLLGPARRRIVARKVEQVVVPPAELMTTGERLAGVISGGRADLIRAAGGAGLGTAIGVNTGFAFLGTAVSGAWVLAPLFGLAAVVAGRASK